MAFSGLQDLGPGRIVDRFSDLWLNCLEFLTAVGIPHSHGIIQIWKTEATLFVVRLTDIDDIEVQRNPEMLLLRK